VRIPRNPAAAAALAVIVFACGGTPATQPPAGSAPTGSDAPAQSEAPESVAPESVAPESDAPESDAPPSGEPGATLARVAIGDNTFSPAALEVSVDDEVVWRHNGENPHTVTFADDGPDSGNLANGETYRLTFEEAGEFSYVCAIHSQMQGTVTVSE
jgi:plastocyanin